MIGINTKIDSQVENLRFTNIVMRAQAKELCCAVEKNIDVLMTNLNQELRYHRAVERFLLSCLFRISEKNQQSPDVRNVSDFLALQMFFGILEPQDPDMLLKQAICGWERLANEGHPASLFNLGICLDIGLGVEKDVFRAAGLYKTSANFGFAFAQNRFGQCLRDGHGVSKNETMAITNFMNAGNQGLGIAIKQATDLLWKRGATDTETLKQTIWHLADWALKGNGMAHALFMEHLSDEQLRDVQIPGICQELRRQAYDGNLEAQVLYGICLRNGKVAPQDQTSENASSLDETHASDNHSSSVDGVTQEGAEGPVSVEALAVKMFEAAARQGHPDAQYQYWLCWKDRVGDAKFDQAWRFLCEAKDKGHMRALGDYAVFLKNRDDFPAHAQEVVSLLKKAADAGHVDAQYEYGMCFLSGVGVAFPSSRSAAKWLNKAAESGHLEAKYQLGMCLLKRTDGSKDVYTGARCLKEAADAGHLQAKREYAACLRNGIGVEKSKTKAKQYLQDAERAKTQQSSTSAVRPDLAP